MYVQFTYTSVRAMLGQPIVIVSPRSFVDSLCFFLMNRPPSIPTFFIYTFFFFFFLKIRRPPNSPLFPSTPLFRFVAHHRLAFVLEESGHHKNTGRDTRAAQRDCLVHGTHREPARTLSHQHA